MARWLNNDIDRRTSQRTVHCTSNKHWWKGCRIIIIINWRCQNPNALVSTPPRNPYRVQFSLGKLAQRQLSGFSSSIFCKRCKLVCPRVVACSAQHGDMFRDGRWHSNRHSTASMAGLCRSRVLLFLVTES